MDRGNQMEDWEMKIQFVRRKPFGLLSVFLIAALLLAACQSAELPPAGGTAAPSTTEAPAALPETGATPTSSVAEPAVTEPAVTEPAATEPVTTQAATAAEEAEISVATDPELGEILVGNGGMTLYMYTIDGPDQVNCSGDCLVNWPPLVTQGNPVLGEGVDPALVGTAELPDGSLIVTYNQMPLYFWINDLKPGDVTGQDVGGVWYVVSPAGEVIGAQQPAQAPAQAATEAPPDDGLPAY